MNKLLEINYLIKNLLILKIANVVNSFRDFSFHVITYMERPLRNFIPSPGVLHRVWKPDFIRPAARPG